MVWENNFFYLLFLNAVTGSISFLLSKILMQFAKRYGDAKLVYNLLRGVIVFFTVPFSFIYVVIKWAANQGEVLYGFRGNLYTASVFHKIFLVWLIITSAITIYYAIRFITYLRLRTFNIPYFDDELKELFESFYPDSRLSGIHMYTNMMSPTPCIMGVVKPVLVLPEVPYTKEELVIMMAHEATHVIHRDTLVKTIGRVIVTLCWWNPFLLWYMVDLERWSETYCDESVCRLILADDWARYANVLVTAVAKAKVYAAMIRSTSAAFGDKRTLYGRIKRLSKLKFGKRKAFVSLAFGLVFILGSSLTAFAAGDLTSAKGEDVYMRTMEVQSSDVEIINLGEVDNVTVFRMTPEQLAAEGCTVVTMEPEGGVATYGTQKFFDWDIAAASMASSANFLKRKDTTITVSCYVTFPSGQEGNARVGVIEPDGTFVFALCGNDDAVMIQYPVEQLGLYCAAVQNIRSFEINAAGYYVK